MVYNILNNLPPNLAFTPRPDKSYYMFHKPAGVVTAKSDIRHETIMKYLQDIDTPNLHPLGRLDKDTEGLLLLTDDGQFTNYLMSPKNHVPKTYEFCIVGSLSASQIEELENGIYFEKDDKITAPCKLEITSTALIRDVIPIIQTTPYRKLLRHHLDHPVTFGCITITEGRKHHVKKLMKHAHCAIIALKRVCIGNLYLDPNLKVGEYRPLTLQELILLLQ